MGSKNAFYVDIEAFHPKVTGSNILCNVRFPNLTSIKFLVDCGMYQEKDCEKFNSDFVFSTDVIKFVLVTHSHIDHIGRLPLLVKKGYTGPIYTSKEVANYFLEPALRDSLGVIETESKTHGTAPLYTEDDVDGVISQVVGVDYFEEWSPCEGIKVTYYQNAHVPGAAIILVRAKYEGYEPINIVFTGDYNNKNAFFCSRKLPERVTKLPVTIIQEATYGTMNSEECVARFEDKISAVVREQRNVLLFAYSFGRTQEVLYKLRGMQKKGILSTDIPIYLDGKLGIKYTNIYPKLDISERMKDFLPENFHFVSKDQREQLAYSKEQKIIITSSGNGTYGPAQFYAPIFVPDPNAYLAFTGFVQEGTFGRQLLLTQNDSPVSIGGMLVTKLAEVDFFNEFSAHAKADELIDFLRDFENLKLVLVNHGETETKFKYAERVKKEVNVKKVGILDRNYVFRIDSYGFVKSRSTQFL